MNKKIFCIGGATIDFKLKSIDSLELSTSNPVSSKMTFGGVAHNVALNLAYLTNDIFLQCVIGSDSEGNALLTNIQEKNIDTNKCIISENNITARYYAVLDQHGEMHIALIDMQIYDTIHFAQFTEAWQDWQSGDIIFIDTNLSAALLEHAIQQCKIRKIKLCIDPVSISKSKKLPQDLNGVFLIKPDRFEMAALTGIEIQSTRDCIEAGKSLLSRGVEHIVISLGKSGYVVVNNKIQKHFPAIAIDSIVDVSGAGDAFIAGMLFALKQDSTILEACETGAAAAALTLQSHHTVTPNMSSFNLKKQLDQAKREHTYAAIF